MQDTILRVADIQKNYGHIRALQGASLSVKKGSITAVVGDNGSGKSTLIKILSGNIKPDGGIIQVEDNGYGSLTVKKAMELGVRTVYQDLSLDNYKNSIENIFLGAELTKGLFLNRRAMKEEAAAILDSIRVNVPDIEEPVRNLSGGQRQGIAIARALRTPGKLLLLDEPTAAMGIQESHSALNILRSLKERGMSQLIISHNIHQVFDIADYIWVMRSGRCILGVDTADTTLDGMLEGNILPSHRGMLVLNGIAEKDRIQDISLLQQSIAAAKEAEAKGGYFHPAANAEFDRLTDGEISRIQLRSLIANAVLADRLTMK